MTKTILLVRHAKSGWDDPELPDHDRPLNKRGKRDALRVGRFIREQDLVPDLVVTSSAKRAVKTAEGLADMMGFMGEIHTDRALYQSDVESYLDVIRDFPETVNSAMLIGHNPDLEALLEHLTRETETLPTAAVAQVELKIESWREILNQPSGRLVNLWVPREIE